MGDSPKESSLNRLTPGELVAELYKVEKAIGTGGMATVYAARDQSSGAHIALKILRPLTGDDEEGGADARMRMRFFNELAMATRVRHPNIVEVLDFGLTDAGSLYIAMPRLFGMDGLRWMRRRGAVSAVEFIPKFCEVLDALALAHRDAIVHRDIKPANLFFARHDDQRRIVLMDFGIAQRSDAIFGKKRLSGSPRYMAPEYILEQQTSPGVDVYQLGLTLVEFLLGARLMGEADMMACLHHHINGALPIPERLIKSPLGPVVSQAIAYDPNERFKDAGQFCAALRALSEDDLMRTDRALNPQNAPRRTLSVNDEQDDPSQSGLDLPLSGEGVASLDSTKDDTVVAIKIPRDDTVLDVGPPSVDDYTVVDVEAPNPVPDAGSDLTQAAQVLPVVGMPEGASMESPPQDAAAQGAGQKGMVWVVAAVALLVLILMGLAVSFFAL